VKVGSIVVVLGKLDERVRSNKETGLVVGTLEQILCDQQGSVLLPTGEIWIGPLKLLQLAEGQI
jgi:hypothetical protein